MKESDKRINRIFKDALPTNNEKLMDKLRSKYERDSKYDLERTAKIKNKLKTAHDTLTCQNANGLQFVNEKEVRHYLREFNQRSWQAGLLSMPAMFNVMESFFNYNRDLIYFELLDEESYISSLYDFLDYLTTGNTLDENNPIDSIEKDIIYHINFPQSEENISFNTEDGKTYIVGNASIIRRGDEATVVMYCGQVVEEKDDLESLVGSRQTFEEMDKTVQKNPRKKGLVSHAQRKLEIVKFMDQEDLWATTFATRIDLLKETIDLRFIARDLGNSYEIRTDDLSAIVGLKGKFPNPEQQEAFTAQYQEVEDAGPIFELAKMLLYFPHYIDVKENENDLSEMLVTTGLNEVIKGPIGKRKFSKISSKFKKFSTPVYMVNSNNNPISREGIKIRDDRYTIEKNGYWKKIGLDEHGSDKDGNPILGRTWVEETQVYYKNLNSETQAKIVRRFTNEESGYIYIMRKPMMEEGVCKIGLTKRSIEERRKELSSTNTLESFQVVHGIETVDCRKAERAIHKDLDEYRISDRKEFFNVDIQYAISVVNKIVNHINNR